MQLNNNNRYMKKLIFLVSICLLTMNSCLFPRKMVYMRDMRPDVLYAISQKPELKIQPQDRLRISISSQRPALTAPFNLGVGGYVIGHDAEVTTTTTSTIQETGYLVDRQGNIEFPVLGPIRVEGLTKQEAATLIRNQLRDGRQVPDAMVTVEVINFKITVIGEVGSIGIQNVTEDRITLLEAITKAGGVTTNASMGEVLVIREDKRGYRAFQNDLRTVNMLASPTFYLQQNDIVYVKPKAPQPTEQERRSWQWLSIAMSMSSAVISVMLLLNYFKK